MPSAVWLSYAGGSALIAVSALIFMIIPVAWEWPLLWKLIPAIAGVFVFAVGAIHSVPLGNTKVPVETAYTMVFLVFVNAGLINFSFDTLPIVWRVIVWLVGIVVLAVWPWVTDMQKYVPVFVRLAITGVMVSLLAFALMVLIGVPTDTALAFIWVAYLSGLAGWWLIWQTHQSVISIFAALGLTAHMAHALLLFSFGTPLQDFYTGLPLFIFYVTLPLFAFHRYHVDKQKKIFDLQGDSDDCTLY